MPVLTRQPRREPRWNDSSQAVPPRTDGRLTKENLYREADVSRATMNRGHAILDEWDCRTAAAGARTRGEARHDDEVRERRSELRAIKRERTQLQGRLDPSAPVIAALIHDNAAPRDQLAGQGAVVALVGHRPPLVPRPPDRADHLKRPLRKAFCYTGKLSLQSAPWLRMLFSPAQLLTLTDD
ncbi:hypothetical protein [Streptomyces sp. NBC_01190]|uniref:hypothetical protein n=1 Tax=Streptomyces sp. NBC_01190 TaxID=2903767 RepID=UPI003866B372|nr:hypothetical protein OG519_24735 [Streptomyces sp. NBC_01190]